MLIQIIIAILAGIFAGTITGLIPGIHINLIGTLLISFSAILLATINPLFIVIFISAMAITHTFLDFIPSILLGCPDTDTELSVLPGHELLKKGQGYQAIILTCYGSLAAIVIILLISFPSVFLIEKIQNIIPKAIPYLLLASSVFLILSEKKKLTALFVFLLTGFLGFCVLNLQSLDQPLLPLLSGLFGGSMLIKSIKNKTEIPKQKIIKPKIKIFKPLIGAIIASPLCSFLPGMGSGQAAVIGNTISKTDKKGFLILLGATNTLVMGFSFISLYAISKTRTGAASAIKDIMGNLPQNIFILILITILISGIISFFLAKKFAEFFSKNITKFDYSFLSKIILLILTIVVFLVSGFSGLIILIISTATGYYCISLKIRRTHMMGCLLIPTIILYLF